MLLAFDTCGSGCSVALWRDGGIISDAKEIKPYMQAELIVPMLESVMYDAQAEYTELSAIGLTVGPGSFTGVKIGISVAYAISSATGVPLIGVNTLELLAYTASYNTLAKEEISIALSAGRGRFYCQRFLDNTPTIQAYLLEENQVNDFSKDCAIFGDQHHFVLLDASFLIKLILSKQVVRHFSEKYEKKYDMQGGSVVLPKPIYNLPSWDICQS